MALWDLRSPHRCKTATIESIIAAIPQLSSDKTDRGCCKLWSVERPNAYFTCEVSMKESCDGKAACLPAVALALCMTINIKHYGGSLENGKKLH